MGVVLLPRRFLNQPQYAPRLAEAYQDAELLSLCNDGTGKDIAKANHLTYPAAPPEKVLASQGYALNFNGAQRLISERAVTPAPAFTVFAWVRPSVLNTTYARIAESAFGTGFYLGSNAGSKYAWIVNGSSLEGCIGGKQTIGQRDFVCGTFSGSSRILYVNGVQVANASATAPFAAIKIYVGHNSGGVNFWRGDIDTFGILNRAAPAAEIWSLYQAPWQLLKAPARRIFIDAAPGGINLTVTISTIANAAGTAAITQDCTLTGAVSAQANVCSIGAITQGAINNPVGTASTQSNTGGTGVLAQLHVIVAAASTQGNLGDSGAITLGSEDLAGVPSTQGNISASASITLTRTLIAVASTQGNLSGTGAISDGIVVEAALTTGIAETTPVKKPGIPAGTPEWLKTMLEILTGRRGNRVEAPRFQTLTFSATPTKTECEALYGYTNTVRDSLEQLINRMDG